MSEDDKSRIDRLKEALYSRKIKIKPSFVLDLHGHKTSVADKWQAPEVVKESAVEETPRGNFSKTMFWIAVAFFVISALVAGFVYFKGSNLISPNNIKIDVLGPGGVKAGEVTSLEVAITNNNRTTLEFADLLIQYPKGTRNPDDKLTSLQHGRIAFGDIKPGETVRRTIRTILYGETGKSVPINMSLEYRLPNSMSVFNKDITYEALVGSAPLIVSVEGLKEVNANQDYALTVKVVSNSTEVERGVTLAAFLPFGFEPRTISPEPIIDTSATSSTAWDLGDIEPNGQRTITIVGKMYGSSNEERFFRFVVGVGDEKLSRIILAPIVSVTHVVSVKEPFIGVSVNFDKKASESYVAASGATVPTTINWVNNLTVPVYDATVEVSVTGSIVDQTSIKPEAGFYDSNKKRSVWDKDDNDKLGTLKPGTSGAVGMNFKLLSSSDKTSATLTNPSFIVDVTVRAKRRLESGVPEEIISTVRKTVKIVSAAHLTSRAVHTVGPIENEGSIPPKVGEKTTYTIMWALTNTFNRLSGAKVSARLPDYITWTSLVTPSDENISYNPETREVSWNVGNVTTQTKSGPTVRMVAFQVAFIPSSSQVGTTPEILGVANFEAGDTFSGVAIKASNDPLTINLETDPGFNTFEPNVLP